MAALILSEAKDLAVGPALGEISASARIRVGRRQLPLCSTGRV